MSEPMLDAKLRDLIEKRQAATIRGWWNDGPRKTWRSDFADPATRDAWFEELSRQLVANFPFGALLAAVPALSEPGGLAEGDVAARVNSVLDGIGIYPEASPAGQRTPWQTGWNAAVMELSDRIEAALAAVSPQGEGPGLDAATEPGAWLSRGLLLRAVDLRAVAWNALCAVPVSGGDWSRFWRKLHELREAVNRPEHEDIRLAYASTFGPGSHMDRDDTHVLSENWRIVDRAAAPLPRAEKPEDER